MFFWRHVAFACGEGLPSCWPALRLYCEPISRPFPLAGPGLHEVRGSLIEVVRDYWAVQSRRTSAFWAYHAFRWRKRPISLRDLSHFLDSICFICIHSKVLFNPKKSYILMNSSLRRPSARLCSPPSNPQNRGCPPPKQMASVEHFP